MLSHNSGRGLLLPSLSSPLLLCTFMSHGRKMLPLRADPLFCCGRCTFSPLSPLSSFPMCTLPSAYLPIFFPSPKGSHVSAFFPRRVVDCNFGLHRAAHAISPFKEKGCFSFSLGEGESSKKFFQVLIKKAPRARDAIFILAARGFFASQVGFGSPPSFYYSSPSYCSLRSWKQNSSV